MQRQRIAPVVAAAHAQPPEPQRAAKAGAGVGTERHSASSLNSPHQRQAGSFGGSEPDAISCALTLRALVWLRGQVESLTDENFLVPAAAHGTPLTDALQDVRCGAYIIVNVRLMSFACFYSVVFNSAPISCSEEQSGPPTRMHVPPPNLLARVVDLCILTVRRLAHAAVQLLLAQPHRRGRHLDQLSFPHETDRVLQGHLPRRRQADLQRDVQQTPSALVRPARLARHNNTRGKSCC